MPHFRLARTANATATAFTSKVPTATEPSGAGIHSLDEPDLFGIQYVTLIPFGTDGNNDTFDMRLWGWSKEPSLGVWVPHIIVDLSIVLGNIAGTPLAANTVMADTLTLNKGIPAGVFSGLNNTANDTTASITVDVLGCQKIEFDFDLAGGQEAVSMNCLWRAFSNPRR